MKEYDHKKIESKVQKEWEKKKIYQAKDGKGKKFYSLIEFPYPSGDGLHVGHPRPYIGMDVISRKKRMEGFNVLYPIGWDAFGLPTENYAIKTGIHPVIVTKKNTDNFRRQIKMLGISFDWSREINTTDPKYYKWTQWIFLQFFKKGLAYKAKSYINWCPKDKIGLANEEAVGGICDRCGSKTEKREKEQWMLAITKYADRLDKDLDLVDYPERVKIQQRNWIGKSEGSEIEFKIKTTYPLTPSQKEGKNNYLILPGWESNPDDHFYQWLKKELEPARVQIVKWSGQASEKWIDLVLKNYIINENTVIIGHSLGVAVGMKIIEKLNHKIAGLVTIGGFIEPKFKDHTRPFEKTFKWKFDFQKIKEKTGFIKILSDKSDYAVSLQQGKILAEELEGQLIEITANKPHFCGKAEQAILNSIFLKENTYPLTSSQKKGEFGYHTTDPKTWKALQNRVFEMRNNPTQAEDKLWQSLRKNLTGYHFRRQHVIDRFVVDFVCLAKNLVIEVDGDIHDYQKEKDRERTDILKGLGFKIIRFKNEEVLQNIASVIQKIESALEALPFGEGLGEVIKVFTTRADTLFGATYVVLAPEHPLVAKFLEQVKNKKEVEEYAKKAKKKSEIERTADEKEKTGVELKGIKAINPANNEEMPVFIADYVLPDYGTGAIMAVPAHDERDFAFAKKYNLPIKQVIYSGGTIGKYWDNENKIWCPQKRYEDEWNEHYEKLGKLIDSGNFSGLASREAIKKITEFVGGKMVTKFKLRDWVFSRQRYWGEPIPLVNCEKCGLVPVPDKDLPIKLPEVKSYKPTDTGESPLASISKWVNTKCPKCGGRAKRETDTMPNWAGSSWYYLRYTDPKNNKVFADKKKLKYWTPVDWYNGGMEHTTLHLLYSRFWHKFLYDLKLVPTVEPYQKRTSHGMILGEGGVKMSKSLGNVVNPDDIVKTYGADTLRVYEMFMGPFEEAVAWSTESIIGSRRFIEKVWRIGEKILASSNFSAPSAKNFSETAPSESKGQGTHTFLKNSLPTTLTKLLHKTIKKVSEDVENMRFNTAISAMMILATEMEKAEGISAEDYKKFLQILAPFAPHITENIWQNLRTVLKRGSPRTVLAESIHLSAWPKWDESLVKDQEIRIAVQVNGKVRSEILIQMNETEDEVKKKALADENVLKHLNKDIKRVIYVKNRVINILS